MLGDIVGYCIITKNSKSWISPAPIADYEGKPIRVLEFGHDGCVMVLHNKGTAIATFNKEDILSKFECSTFRVGDVDVICKKSDKDGFFDMEKQTYVQRCLHRKGGYNSLLSNMVIAASLHKGEFCDDFLWQMQNE